MTYQPPPGRGPFPPPPPQLGPPQPPSKRHHALWLVLAAAVLGVFVFCGIVVAAAGNSDKPTETKNASGNGAPAVPTTAPQTTAPQTTAAEVPPPATTAPPITTTAPAPAKTTKPPTTKPATTKPAANCNPNYTPCVPNDPVDVDCAGGTGNGPSYVEGPVRVIGSDPYKLDADHDGIGCE